MEVINDRPLAPEVLEEIELQVRFLDSLPDNRITMQRVREILGSAKVPPDHPVRDMLRNYTDDAYFTHQGLCEFFSSAGIPLSIEIRPDGAPPMGFVVEKPAEAEAPANDENPEGPKAPESSNEKPSARPNAHRDADAPVDNQYPQFDEETGPSLGGNASHFSNQPGSQDRGSPDPRENDGAPGSPGEAVQGSLAGAVLAKLFGVDGRGKSVVKNPQPLSSAANGRDSLSEGAALGALVNSNVAAMQKLRKEMAPFIQQLTTGKSTRGSILSDDAKDRLVTQARPLLAEYNQRMSSILEFQRTGSLFDGELQTLGAEAKAAKGFMDKLAEGKLDPHLSQLHEMSQAIAKMIVEAIEALLGKGLRAASSGHSPS